MQLPSLPKPKAIIFDWDNTIADTWIIINKALNLTFREFGLPEWDLAETKKKVALSMKDSFPKYFGHHTEKAAKIYRNHYINLADSLYEIYDDVREMLSLANQKNILLSVVSNKSGDILRKEVKELELAPHFHRVIGSMDASRDKPFPDPVFLALEETGITPSAEVWFIGDSIVDMECAYNTGCTPIFYGEIIDTTLFSPFTPKHNITTHKQLIELINAI